MTLSTAYFDIIHKARGDDGHLRVYGKATDSSLDIDSQICDETWLKEAMPRWFSWGNIREQHSSIAAGVATAYEAKDDGHYIEAKVVDQNSAKKVEEGVLKGFSVGIKNPRIAKDKDARGGRIVGGEIVEVSLVDRPANSNCKLVLAKAASGATFTTGDAVEGTASAASGILTHTQMLVKAEELIEQPTITIEQVADPVEVTKAVQEELAKRDFSDEKRQELADKGHALPDGSFPIENVTDLKNAIQAHGRAANKTKARAHIKKRAKDLGRSDLIPEEWGKAADPDLEKDGGGDYDPEDWCNDILDKLRHITSKEMAEATLYGRDETPSLNALAAAANAVMAFMQTEADEWKSAGGDDDNLGAAGAVPEDAMNPAGSSTHPHHLAGSDNVAGRVDDHAGAVASASMGTQPNPGQRTVPALTYATDANGGPTLADLVKSASLDERTELMGILSGELTTQVESIAEERAEAAVTGKVAALEAEVKALSEDLAKVMKMAAPGGPSRMGKAAAVATTTRSDIEAQARHYRQQAEVFKGQPVAEGYLALAKKLEKSILVEGTIQ